MTLSWPQLSVKLFLQTISCFLPVTIDLISALAFLIGTHSLHLKLPQLLGAFILPPVNEGEGFIKDLIVVCLKVVEEQEEEEEDEDDEDDEDVDSGTFAAAAASSCALNISMIVRGAFFFEFRVLLRDSLCLETQGPLVLTFRGVSPTSRCRSICDVAEAQSP